MESFGGNGGKLCLEAFCHTGYNGAQSQLGYLGASVELYLASRRIILISYVLLFSVNHFLQIHLLSLISYFLLFLIVILTLPVLGKTNRIVSLGMVLAGSAILLVTGTSFSIWLEAFSRNAALAALLITIPMLNIPFSYGDYQEQIKMFAKRHVRSPLMFCFLAMLLSHLFGLIILVGAIPLVYHLFSENAKLYGAEKQFISALVHGQVFGGFWSPVWSSMIILTAALDIPWLQFVPLGIAMSVLALFSSMVRCRFSLKRSHAITLAREDHGGDDGKILLMIGVLTLLPIILIVLLNWLTGLSIITVIPMVSVLFPVIIAAFQRRWGAYRSGMGSYVSTRILGVKNEVVLLTAAGFFGKALEIANVQSAVRYLIPEGAAQVPYLAIVSIMSVYIITAHFGLHPVVAGSAMVVSLDPAVIGLSPYMFGFTLMCGWAIGILLSPFSATNMVTGGLTAQPSWNISAKMHGLYGLVLLCGIAAILTILARFL